MAFHYSDGSYVGGCGAQIGGLIGIIAISALYGSGMGIGWAILIVSIVAIAIMVLYDIIKNKK